jgi:tetratricopeptide (TPR) repeat protein
VNEPLRAPAIEIQPTLSLLIDSQAPNPSPETASRRHSGHAPMNKRVSQLLLTVGLTIVHCVSAFAAAPSVTITEIDEVIPTYQSGPPEPNPMFYFGRMSQGAEGRVYPYPLYNNLTDRKADQTYRLVYLENEYVKIGIAPGIGGRLFSAFDKTNGYDYVYRQHVIKPALIGLIGAWISGGVEWNIPHHHRASTYLPVQYRTEENADGSKTVWVGELEIRDRMRWAVGYTLHPGSSVLTCSIRILNRTPLEQTMLCFANIAVNSNDDYQVIYPPSTQWVTHHFKREFTQWPIARQPYGGVNWDGQDVSYTRNHSAANSMFAWNYDEDFCAGYDHGKQAGFLSVADHHQVPGKKFWTWGNGPRGKLWEKILTDNDGPYIELMVGAYSDNQPDYTWLQPYAARSFDMNWYPFRDIGGVKDATVDAAVNIEVKDGIIHYGFYSTKAQKGATTRLTIAGKIVAEATLTIDPATPYTNKLPLPAGATPHDVRASLLDAQGRELVGYSPIKLTPTPPPAPYTHPKEPADYKTDEQLTLSAQRIGQFHDPDRDPEPWFEEQLRRDPGNSAAHTGLGLRALRAARYVEAQKHFTAAVSRLTDNHTTPKNAEPLYYLGVALRGQDRLAEAYDAFFKAAWKQEWKAPAYFQLAEISALQGDLPQALAHVNHSLEGNALNVRAYGLKAALLRHLKREAEARETVAYGLRQTDPLDVRLRAEGWLLARDAKSGQPLFATLNDHLITAQELAAEYANAGLWADATLLLGEAIKANGPAAASPLIHYYLGHFAEKLGQADVAARHRRTAASQSPAYVFPFQAELISVLRRAMAANPTDARAPYYLGNLLYDWQPAEALTLWEKAAALDPTHATVWRNLSVAYAQSKTPDAKAKAVAAIERAVALPNVQATHLAERDAFYADTAVAPAQRLAALEKHRALIANHDEALARLISLKIFTGKIDEAISLLQSRTFNIWEGGTKFNSGYLWTDAHLARGIARLKAGQAREALTDFLLTTQYPDNLRAYDDGSRLAELGYWTGRAHEALGDRAQATALWQRAAEAKFSTGRRNSDVETPDEAFRHATHDYHRALALRSLGQKDEADKILRGLAQTGTADTPQRYATGLGHAGLGGKDQARAQLTATLSAQPDNLGAAWALQRLND